MQLELKLSDGKGSVLNAEFRGVKDLYLEHHGGRGVSVYLRLADVRQRQWEGVNYRLEDDIQEDLACHLKSFRIAELRGTDPHGPDT